MTQQSDTTTQEPKHKRLTFDPTINAGHILTFVAMAVTVFLSWTTLDKRVVVLEESRQYQRLRDDTQDQTVTQQLVEIKAAISEVKTGVNEIRRDQRGKP